MIIESTHAQKQESSSTKGYPEGKKHLSGGDKGSLKYIVKRKKNLKKNHKFTRQGESGGSQSQKASFDVVSA